MDDGVVVEIRENATGHTVTAQGRYAWAVPREAGDASGIEYWWAEGNGSCDCNRGITFNGVIGETRWVECGDSRFSVRLTVDGVVMVDEISNQAGGNGAVGPR